MRNVLLIAIVLIAIAGIPFLVGSKWYRNWKEAVVVERQRQELEAKQRVAVEQYKVDIEQYKVDIEPIQQFLDLWVDELRLASQTPRIALAPRIAHLQDSQTKMEDDFSQ